MLTQDDSRRPIGQPDRVNHERFECLDSLRYFLAIAVVLGHAVGWENAVPHGALAVDFFFVLSGFVLARSLARRRRSFARFARERFARLYPLHLITLALLVAFTAWTRPLDGFDIKQAGLHAAFVNGLGFTHEESWNWPSWTISVEFTVNVAIMYFLATYDLRKSAMLIVAAGSAYFMLFRQDFSHAAIENRFFVSDGLIRGLTEISLGYLVFKAYAYLRHSPWRHHAVLKVATYVALAGAAVILFCPPFRLYAFVSVGLMSAAILLLPVTQTRLAGLLGTPPLPLLGAASFSLYLWHAPMLVVARQFGWMTLEHPSIPSSALFVAGVSAFSIASYFYIELPAQRLLLGNRPLSNAKPIVATR
jgi:peptidoglycan/LPS O-acetylase OafA/YrhL